MSELPIAPAPDQKSAQEKNNTEYYYTSSEFARDINALSHGPEVKDRFNLEAEDTLNPDIWTDTTTTIEAPEYASVPKSRAQEIEETLFYRSDKENLQYLFQNTRVLVAMRDAA